jgi:hypothetical protein
VTIPGQESKEAKSGIINDVSTVLEYSRAVSNIAVTPEVPWKKEVPVNTAPPLSRKLWSCQSTSHSSVIKGALTQPWLHF